jgi:hypothetical protein
MVVSSAMTHVFTMCIYARLMSQGIDNHELNSLKLVDAEPRS